MSQDAATTNTVGALNKSTDTGNNKLFSIGDVLLNLYKVTSSVYTGGMGNVVRVHHSSWNVDLAMKQPHSYLLQNSKIDLFIKEFEAWVALGLHPNIVTCYYVRLIDGVPSIFSEWIDNGSLKESIISESLYTGTDTEVLSRILDIAIQMARGLNFSHTRGLIHQDVKPANVLLSSDGSVKITDFGIANIKKVTQGIPASENQFETMVTDNGGYTLLYCSPEQMSGKPLTRRSDIWSWAITLLEMFTGKCVWANGVLAGLTFNELVRQARIPVPKKIATLLQRCFQIEEVNRPHDFSEIEEELIHVFLETAGYTYFRDMPVLSEMSVESLNNKALSFMDLGKIDDAIATWEQALRISPTHIAALYNYTLCLWRKNSINDLDAIAKIRTRCESKPDVDSAKALSYILIESGRYREARELLASFGIDTNDIRETDTLYARCIDNAVDGAQLLDEIEYCNDENNFVWHGLCYHPNEDVLFIGGSNVFHFDIVKKSIIYRKDLDGKKEKIISCASFNRAGDNLIIATWSNEIEIWDYKTGNLIFTFPEKHDSTIVYLVVNSTGEYAITTSFYGTSKVWNLIDHSCMATYGVDRDDIKYHHYVHPYFINKHEAFIGLNSYEKENTGDKQYVHAKVSWMKIDVVTGATIQMDVSEVLPSESQWVNAEYCAISNDYKIGISDRHGKYLKFWDMESKQCIRTLDLEFMLGSLDHVCISANNGYFYMADGQKLWKFSMIRHDYRADWVISKVISQTDHNINQAEFNNLLKQTREQYSNNNLTQALESIEAAASLPGFNQNNDLLDLNREIGKYCRIAGFRSCSKEFYKTYHDQELTGIGATFSPDNRYLLTLFYAEYKGAIWDTLKLRAKPQDRAYTSAFSSGVYKAALCREGTLLAGDCIPVHEYGNNTIGTYDLALNKAKTCVHVHKEFLTSFFVNHDETVALSCDLDANAYIWKLDDGKLLHRIDFESEYDDLSAAFSKDGKLLVTSGKDGDILLWNVIQGCKINTFSEHYKHVNSIVFIDDNSVFATASDDNTIKIWTIGNNKSLKTMSINGDTFSFMSLSLSPDRQFLLSSSLPTNDICEISLWHIDSGNCIHTWRTKNAPVSPKGVFCANRNYSINYINKEGINFNQYEWVYSFPGWSEWDDAALETVQHFLRIHPDPTITDIDDLIFELQNKGLGWILREGVEKKISELKPKKPLVAAPKEKLFHRVFKKGSK